MRVRDFGVWNETRRRFDVADPMMILCFRVVDGFDRNTVYSHERLAGWLVQARLWLPATQLSFNPRNKMDRPGGVYK